VTLNPTVDGRSRVAIVHLPTAYDPTTPLPLVINMHGSQSTALAQEGFSGMDSTADADSFIVVYPQGDIPAQGGFEWNVPGEPLFGGAAVPAGSPDDVSFIEKLVVLLEQKYCVNPKRVYATGFSGGARMASQLGCDASGVFAAIAPVSGLRLPTPCPSTRPVPVVSFHGTADPVDPYLGNGQKYWTYSVPEAASRWGPTTVAATAPNGLNRTPLLLSLPMATAVKAPRWTSTRSPARATNGPEVRTYPGRSPRSWVRKPQPSVPMPPCGRFSRLTRSREGLGRESGEAGARYQEWGPTEYWSEASAGELEFCPW
jgi:predicted esterase